jgi:hypothetical protein
MFFRALADLVVLVHLAFIIFVVLGSGLALRWRWIPWVHLPAVSWAALLAFCGWICPLTPLIERLFVSWASRIATCTALQTSPP